MTCLQVSRFDRRLFGYKNDSFDMRVCIKVLNLLKDIWKNIFPFNRIEREREREENSVIILNMERKRNLNIESEFQLIDNFNIFQL